MVIEEALAEAHMTLDDIDAIGVTYGPGLVGALLVGVSEAKAIAYAKNLPLVGVHHIEGHISANYIENKDLEPPFACLVVSGGHTHLVIVKDYGKYEIVGRTRDDAAGEAFDKVARAIGLGYPGGPKIDKVSKEGNPNAIAFPRAKVADSAYDFSFSGLKSAVLNYLNGCKMKNDSHCPGRRGGFLPESGRRCAGGACHACGGRVRLQEIRHCRRRGLQLCPPCRYGRSLQKARGGLLSSLTHSLYG